MGRSDRNSMHQQKHNWQAWETESILLPGLTKATKLVLVKDFGRNGYRNNLFVLVSVKRALCSTNSLVGEARLASVLGLSNSHKVYAESHAQLLCRLRDMKVLPARADHVTLASYKGLRRGLLKLELPTGLINALQRFETSSMTAPMYRHHTPAKHCVMGAAQQRAELAQAASDGTEPSYEIDQYMWSMELPYPSVLPARTYTAEEKLMS